MTYEELHEKFVEDFAGWRDFVASLSLQTVVKYAERALAEKKWMFANFMFIEASTKMMKLSMYCIKQEASDAGIEP